MLTKEFMTTNDLTVLPTTTVEESYGYMKEHRIRHLPVVDRHGDLVGIVSDRDVRQALASPSSDNQASSEVTVGEIMTEKVFTVTPHTK
ncbi:MAG: CBS domain-containing protein [bacterium]